MKVKFWGTRGSIPAPGPSTVRYGGNTPCVEVRTDSGTLLIIDAGTGIRPLGQALLTSGAKPIRGHILLTHTHWDHIQGIPFFVPAFIPGNEFDLYAPLDVGKTLEEVLEGQMEYTYFPVNMRTLQAKMRFHNLVEGRFRIGDATIDVQYLNHTCICHGYRIEADGKVIVYASDTEPHAPMLRRPSTNGKPGPILHAEDRRLVEWAQGADLLIQDTQYTPEEYPAKKGWGHGTTDYAVDVAVASGVKQLAVFHHDPVHDDAMVDRMIELMQKRAVHQGSNVVLFGAYEGQEIEL